jgi:hypothetical protein
MPEREQRQIPRFVAEQYVGGGRAFKSERRQALRRLKAALGDLRTGCAYFPSGSHDVETVKAIVDRIEKDISIANWGR